MLITEGHPGYYYNGTIGLPYQEKEDKDYSLLYQLSINGLIDYQVFYFFLILIEVIEVRFAFESVR